VAGKTKTYYVSGIIQLTVKAFSAVQARERAMRRAQTLMNQSHTINVSLDNIDDTLNNVVALDDAETLDEEEES
jgi:capsule polysaccharide export protein KpsE/RkpR